ncbi:hypothetical protein HMPREF2566_02535 [Staphylococcus sp. HMSC070A07]|uniref:hypothetical protein n=1 Tax=Staphylococcus sp. HMSC070A07 TaxID=1715046 RepID=UPI0008AA0779|nr:hypothetical protein [Staphylococcus sp. HMSC070A07]OHQ48932.1 hypothetical protein HMPREF2566_02535 [Staphylococcus sp. HMSC070A07]
MKRIAFISLLFLVFVLSACGGLKDDVQGYWKSKHNLYIIDDDTITYQYSKKDKDVYNYKVVNDNGSTLTIDKWPKGEKKEDYFEREKWQVYDEELNMYSEEDGVIEAYKSKKPSNPLKWPAIICIIIAAIFAFGAYVSKEK